MLVAAVDSDDGDPEHSTEIEQALADWSEHGLGIYLDPTATDSDKPIRDEKGRRLWVAEGWQSILNNATRRARPCQPGPAVTR